MWIKFKKWICKRLGHSFSVIDTLVYEVEINALNAPELKPEIICRRCGDVFIPKPKEMNNG